MNESIGNGLGASWKISLIQEETLLNKGLKKMKRKICVALVLFLVFCSIPLTINSSANSNQDNIENVFENFALQTDNIPILRIEDISDSGIGMTISIKNIGSTDVSEASLHIISSSGLLIPIKNYDISTISAGSTKNIKVSIFGFGTGIFFDFPEITFVINSPESATVVGKIKAKIIGPIVTIFSKLFNEQQAFDGYSLVAPMWDTDTYLMDNVGNIVHSWSSIYLDTQAVYLLENGNLLRTSVVADASIFSGGGQGRIEMFDWDGNCIWMHEYSTEMYCQHHDIEPLPNGNILLVAWELKTRDQALAAGRNPDNLMGSELWPDHIVEIEPVGDSDINIVWEWHVWDHLVQEYDPTKANYGIVSEHPELIDINYGGSRADWNHINAIDYNEELDQILLSVKVFDEIWVIDHSTTTEEAAGHTGGRYGKGGDILYRWGNPQTYNCGDAEDQLFFGQHGTNWIESDCPGAGNILVFNNYAGGYSTRYSSVDEIIPPIDEYGNYEYTPGLAYGPSKQKWVYTADNPTDIFSAICSNAQRLPNGNTLICSASQGLFYEINKNDQEVWIYNNPYPTLFVNKAVTEIIRYPVDYPGIKLS